MPVQIVNAKALDRLNKLPSAVTQANKKAVERAAFAMKRSVQKQPGYRDRLKNVGKSGARLNVRYDLKGLENKNAATAIVKAVGPFQLIERDTKAHSIMPRGVGRAQGRTKAARRQAKQDLYDALFGGRVGSNVKPLRTPYGPRYRVDHPGTKGRHPFEKGVNAALPEVRKIMGNATTTSIRQTFLGGVRF